MTCSACTSAVESALGALSGVSKAVVSLLQQTARVEYDGAVCTEVCQTLAVFACIHQFAKGQNLRPCIWHFLLIAQCVLVCNLTCEAVTWLLSTSMLHLCNTAYVLHSVEFGLQLADNRSSICLYSHLRLPVVLCCAATTHSGFCLQEAIVAAVTDIGYEAFPLGNERFASIQFEVSLQVLNPTYEYGFHTVVST